MGRAKIPMEYIKKDKARSITFDKRKKGLKKKAHELATLCGVPVCVLIYEGPKSEPDTFPARREEVRSIIDRYVSVPKEESSKRSLNLQDFLDNSKKKRKADHYPSWTPDLDGCTKEDLLRVNSDLDDKMRAVKERIGNLIGGNSIGGDFLQIGTGFEHGSSSGGGYYDPNVFYCGQVGGGGGCDGDGGYYGVTSQPMMPAVYGGNVRFESSYDQMGMGGDQLYEEGNFFYY